MFKVTLIVETLVVADSAKEAKLKAINALAAGKLYRTKSVKARLSDEMLLTEDSQDSVDKFVSYSS